MTLFRGDIFVEHGGPLAYSYAHGRHTVPDISSFHFMDKGCADANATASEWMTDSDSPSVNINQPWINFQLAYADQRLCGKCLIQFKESDVAHPKARALQ
jgi:hypothetical protein